MNYDWRSFNRQPIRKRNNFFPRFTFCHKQNSHPFYSDKFTGEFWPIRKKVDLILPRSSIYCCAFSLFVFLSFAWTQIHSSCMLDALKRFVHHALHCMFCMIYACKQTDPLFLYMTRLFFLCQLYTTENCAKFYSIWASRANTFVGAFEW